MAIAKIKCIRVIGFLDKLYEVAEQLNNTHSFQPDDPFSFYSNTQKFLPVQSSNPYDAVFEEFRDALETNNIKCKPCSVLLSDYSEEQIKDYVVRTSEKLIYFTDKRKEINERISECRSNAENVSHFFGLDVELNQVNECSYIKANFGRMPKDSFEKLKAYEDNPFVIFFPCSSDDEYYWGMYVSPIANSDDIDRIFSGLYFERFEVGTLSGTPEQYCEEQKKIIPKLQAELEKLGDEYDAFLKSEQNNINIYYSLLKNLRQVYEIMGKAVYYNNSFVLVGWVTDGKHQGIIDALSGIESVECSLSDGKDELKHSPPVKLKNNPLTRGFEFYTQMYGLPNYREFDPTAFVAIVYTILFGIMFGDVGHGLMIVIAGIIMKKCLKMPIGSILIPCGISGTIFGFVYGSVCGYEDVLNPLYKVLFGLDKKPISVMEPAMTNNIIYLAVGIGIVLVTLAIILNIITSFKLSNVEEAVFGNNGVSGLVFYVSVVAALVLQMFLGIKVLSPLYIIVLIAIPLLLMFLKEPLGKLAEGKKDWRPAKWGEYCVQNFFELFEVLLSYVTNTMSFLRVGAFVLVHAGMMEVVFTLANMTSGVGYVAIVVFGNLFVMALEALLVCIQVLRLEFYEMFGRFYRGDGRAYSPVNAVSE